MLLAMLATAHPLPAPAESPQWRRGPAHKPMLCNACGTRFRRTNQLGPPANTAAGRAERAQAAQAATVAQQQQQLQHASAMHAASSAARRAAKRGSPEAGKMAAPAPATKRARSTASA